MTQDVSHSRAKTGIEGLDDVLSGGFVRRRMYLLEGSPGTGKTTTSLQFLLEGTRQGERCLYITLSETEEELRDTADSHGWTLPPELSIFELVPPESLLDEHQQQSVLYSSDLELGETTKRIFAAIEEFQPARIVLDSLSEIRLLAQGSLRYRRQVLALKHYFSRYGATVLLLDDMTSEPGDRTVHSLAHGVVQMEQLAPLYGSERRRLRVVKYRASSFRGGYHDCTIKRGGVSVFPRLVAADHQVAFERGACSSNVPELDALMSGGAERGSSTLFIGPSGSGKSLVAYQFVAAAIARGEKASIFSFDEELGLLLARTRALGIDLGAMQASGALQLQSVDAAELSPGEFAHIVRASVVDHGSSIILIDSLNGYQAAMPEEQFLVLHMHELLQFLNRQGVASFVTLAQHGLVGDMQAPVDITYLADTLVLFRYFEVRGAIRRAISVIKKRAGGHEQTIRELSFDEGGVSISKPLGEFQGVLRGVPSFVGGPPPPASDAPAP